MARASRLVTGSSGGVARAEVARLGAELGERGLTSGCGQTRILLAAAAVGAARKVQQRAREAHGIGRTRMFLPPVSSRVHFCFSVSCFGLVWLLSGLVQLRFDVCAQS